MKHVLSALIIAACGSAQADLIYGKSTLLFPAGPGILREGTNYSPEISSDGNYISFITNRMDVRANDEADSLDVVRADVARSVVQTVNRVANGTYFVPTAESRTYISDRGRFIAFNSNQEIRANNVTVNQFAGIRAGLARNTIDSLLNQGVTGMSNDGDSLHLNSLYGQTFTPVRSFNFLAGAQGTTPVFPSTYSPDGKVRLASVALSSSTGPGLQVTTRSGRFWLLAVASASESFTPVWVSNDAGPSTPILAHFITNRRISPFDLDSTPDLYYANASTGELRLIPLSGAPIKAVAASRNGRFTVIQYTDGMADVVDVITFPGKPGWIRRIDLRHLPTISRNVSDSGRFIAGITTDGRLVRQDLNSGVGTETGIGPFPAPPKAKLTSYVNSPTGTCILFRAPDQFLSGESAGTFIKNTATGITRRLPSNTYGYAVSDTGQAYIYNDGAGITYRNDDLNSTVKLPNGFGQVISSDGLTVMFYRREGSFDQLFVYDVLTARTRLVTRNASGAAANSSMVTPRLSPNGKLIAFISDATNLVEGPPRRRLCVYDVATVKLTATAFSTSLGESSVVVGISADATKIVFADLSYQDTERENIWRYYVPRRAFTYAGERGLNSWAQLSPSGNLVYQDDEDRNILFRVSDGRRVVLSDDFSLFLLPGDNRARMERNGVLSDVNFAFPPTP
jgi:Tol biopolymer transport system component